MILLDTHILTWLLLDDRRIGGYARQVINRSWSEGRAAVSAITFWEVAMLHEKGRISLLTNIGYWRMSLLDEGLVEIAVDGRIGVSAASLADFHADPAGRLIVATALGGHQLVTADREILNWAGALNRLDARE